MDPDRRDAARQRPWAHTRLGARGVHHARRARRGAATLIRLEALNIVFLTLGALLGALSFNLFLAPGDLAPGGFSGLTLAVKELVSLPVPNGVLMMLLNLPLLYLGYRSLGGTTFVVRTVYVVVVLTVSIDVTAPMLPGEGITEDGLLNALYGGGLMGAGNAMIIRAFGNMGGTGIVARLIQRVSGVPIGQIYLLSDGAIVVLLGAVFGWEHALYSMVALFVNGMVTDYGLEGPSIVRTVFIVTDHPNEVAEALQVRLRTGVTSWEGKGMYRGGQRTVLFCTVNRAEVRELGRIVREADHHGFMVIGQGQRASGGTIGQSDAPG